MFRPVPDLPMCLSTGPGWPGEGHLSAKKKKKPITVDFCLCYVILNLKAFCFGAIPDIMIELIVYESVHLLQGQNKGPHLS